MGFSRRDIVGGAAAAVAASAVPQRVRALNRHDVLVIGAGLSGLHAARILDQQGMDVMVLEGRNRLGGRVYTLMDVPGKPEAAGELIGGNYARMINTARELELPLMTPPDAGPNRDWLYHIRGEFITGEDWPEHRLNPLSGDDRKVLPHRILWDLTHRNNPLSGRGLEAWLTPEFEKYDISHYEYLKGQGWNEETIRLMDVVIHTNDIHTTSALHELRRYHVGSFNSDAKFEDGTSIKQIEGGNSRMPEAMAASLKRQPKLNMTVVGFRETADEVEVHCADGSIYRAKHVICSIPLPVLRDIEFDPRMEATMGQAVARIDYGLSMQAHFRVKEPFWEKDGLEGSMWTDGPLERFATRLPKADGDPIGAIAFINGEASRKFRLMSDEAVFDYIEKQLYALRPAAKGTLERLQIQSCERDPHGAGDWVYWQAGQIKKYANLMRNPHGRIQFCGEHTAALERGMEGAFESGERAALATLGLA